MRHLLVLFVIVSTGLSVRAGDPPPIDEMLRDQFQYRNLGPYRVGSWITDVAVPEAPARAHLYTLYVGARNGGVWKSTNNGTTFQPVFENQEVSSVGALAVAPSSADVVWVGTGDNSCARSSYSGNGVHKSTDGGRTWQHMGLKESHHIARIVIHPTNPDIVFVAALGHLFTPNDERGVFQTIDGGKTWKKVLFVDDLTGAVDLVMNRSDTNTLYAATFQCRRDPWRLHDGGPGTGIYKSSDGGGTWQKLEKGLPGGTIGRIGIDICRKNPQVLYAVVDNRNSSTPGGRNLVGGEVYRTDDGGASWRKVSPAGLDVSNKSGYAFNQLRVDPNNPERIIITGSSLFHSQDGGKSFGGGGGGGARGGRPFGRAFGDFRAIWFDPQDSERMIATSDGGVYLSYDGGRTCDHLANLPLGEVYALTVDMDQPYNIYAGLQDHESWKGPSNGWTGNVGFEHWSTVGTGDGMYNQVDPTDSRWVFNTQEFGRHSRFDQKLRVRTSIAPTRAQGGRLRFNWVAPLRLSPNDPKTLYAGAEVLFRSRDRGDNWEVISPDLTTNDPKKISPPGTSIQFCTITTISESPSLAGVIWVGTDDGKVQVTKDAGKNWTDATAAVAKAGGPEDAWVSRVFASHFEPGTAYVAKSRHRQDDFRPFLYKTTDYGATWTAIDRTLPPKPINVVVEDNKNPNFLVVGNDIGVYVSVDGGKQWHALKGNMPVAPVHDLVIHPREGDLVAGTYGRGIWISNVALLRELNEDVLNENAHFFAILPKARRVEGALGNYRLYGDRPMTTPNEPNGITLAYYLKDQPKARVNITVADSKGTTVQTIEGTSRRGINRLVWAFNDSNRRVLPPGEYVVTLVVDDQKLTQKARILPDEVSGQAPGR